MNPRPVEVQPLEDYKLLVTFKNGERKVFDMKPLMATHRMYEPLFNKGFFSLVKADGMCVYWNDEIDVCPDWTYEESVPYSE